MESDPNNLIGEQVKKLPQNLKRAVEAIPWKSLVQEIGKSNGLDPDQIVSLEQETMFIIYAFENPNDYIRNMVRELEITEEKAGVIAEAVAEKIFEPIISKAEELNASNSTIAVPPTSVPEIAPEIHPMTEPGEVAHDTPHREPAPVFKPVAPVDIPQPAVRESSEAKTEAPNPRATQANQYSGKDPYREPIE